MPVALVTAAALPGLFADDRLLLAALRRRGVAAEPAIWEDHLYPWADADLVVIRSAWDYSWRRDDFLAWADRVPEGLLWNPATTVRWNTHKRYLLDLEERGVPIIPTRLLPRGVPVDLAATLRDAGWNRAVLKPAVGQSGRYAMPVEAETMTAVQARLDLLLAHEDMLLQPFVPQIGSGGELSATFVEGRFTHAVRKRAAAGDFRVHDDYGGTVEREEPDPAALRVAERAMEAAGSGLLYGRVDLVTGLDGQPAVMELELVEPELFFSHAPDTAGWLADAIAARC